MPRPSLTPSQRAHAVVSAYEQLGALITRAQNSLAQLGPTHPDTIALWESVEQHGATIHRQSRLLAGKSKGG